MTTPSTTKSLAAPVSAVDILARIRNGELTVREAIAGFAETAREKEEILSCFVEEEYEPAPAQPSEPLMGLPVAIKDIIDVCGLHTRHGSPIYRDYRAMADAPCVTATRAAGGTIAGKTVTTEFAYFQARGTRNPWNPSYSPGGSSSGSAAGVAAGMFPLALGTQTGGSIIRPAAFCGIAGYKPTFAAIPAYGSKPFSPSLDTIGVFGARRRRLRPAGHGADGTEPRGTPRRYTAADRPVPDLAMEVCRPAHA